jgi:hypothetical protein
MALYLKKGMLSVAKSVSVTVDLSKLGKISTNRIAKFLLSGIILGDGIPAQIANSILRQHKQPHLRHWGWSIEWVDLPEQAIEEIRTVGNAIKLSAPNLVPTRYQSHHWLNETLLNPQPTGSFGMYSLRGAFNYDEEIVKTYSNHFKTIKLSPSDDIKQLAKGIKARTIKSITLTLYSGE